MLMCEDCGGLGSVKSKSAASVRLAVRGSQYPGATFKF